MSKWLLLEYPPCSTCQKARRWLQERGVSFESRHIKENRPTGAELREWTARSGLPLRRFFNTSGLVYRSLTLKDKLPSLTEEEQLSLLSSDGMLVKRPLLVGESTVLVGFRPAEWEAAVK